MTLNKIKNDWCISSIGEVCQFTGGGTPSKAVKEYWNGDLPWASIKDIKGDYLTKTQDFITVLGLKNSASNVAQENELIIATRINPGKPLITKIAVAINQDLKIARPKAGLDLKFIFYLFKSIEKKVLKLSSGTTVLGINLNNLNTIEIALPPLPIQRAIVSRIEELFSSLDQGIADLKRAQAQLKIYRQAVLKKAFEGKLTKVPMTKGVNIGSVTEINPKLENKNLINGDFEVQFVPMKLVEEVNNKIHLNEVRTFGEIQGKAIRISQMVM